MLQRVAVCCRARGGAAGLHMAVVDYVAVCCNVLQLVVVCSGSSCSYVCSRTHGGQQIVLQCVAAFGSVLQRVAVCCGVLKFVAVC